MKRIALEQYTKQKRLLEQNQQEILDRFIEYCDLCSDPLNIFKYMEEKSICIYLGNYWIYKAEVLAKMGDFKNSYVCLKQAESRDHIINQNETQIEEHTKSIYKNMLDFMKKRPPKGKRSAKQYQILHDQPQQITFDLFKQTADIYDNGYEEARREIQRQYNKKAQEKQKSWLALIQQRKSHNFQQKMKSLGNFQQIHSLRTPISKRDPMKLTKTMDSIEMIKKKKTTSGKKKQEDSEEDIMMAHSTPVGNMSLKRRVTFRSGLKIEKIRGQSPQQPRQKSQSNTLTKRSSILKNKFMGSEKMEEQDS